VNWAPWNPAPLPGMVRAWTWEAFAHGAEVVSYFRWRQAPFAQEQMHAGLHTPDNREASATGEVREVARELGFLPAQATTRADVALLFDYGAKWLMDIQPQGADFDYFHLVLDFYGALRRKGLDVDVISPDAPLDGYRIIVAPSLPIISPDLVDRLAASGAEVVIGPRTGSKTDTLHIADGLPPGHLQRLLPLRVTRVESLRPGWVEAGDFRVSRWLEHIDTALPALASTASGLGFWYRSGRIQYVGAWPGADLLDAVIDAASANAGLDTLRLGDDVRIRRRGGLVVAINYGPEAIDLATIVPGIDALTFLIGERHIPPAGVAIWRAM